MDALVAAFVKKADESTRGEHGGPFGWLGGVAIMLTAVFVYSQVAITYTHGSLVGTLAMVENTSPTAIIQRGPTKDGLPAYTDDPDAPPPSYSAEEVLLLTPTPITSSNMGTVRHLKRIGGRGARFRGLGIAVIYALLAQYVYMGIYLVSGSQGMMGHALSFVVSQLVLMRINMLWTHMVISAPRTDVRLRERFIPWSRAKKAVMPTLGWALAQLAIPATVIVLLKELGVERLLRKLDREGQLEQEHILQLALAGGAVVLASLALLVLVYVPVNVGLTRCHASLLADAETPIVPLDRTFGGRVDPENPRMRLRSAWQSFDWNGRVRLAKVYVKTLAFQLLATVGYLAALALAAAVWAVV